MSFTIGVERMAAVDADGSTPNAWRGGSFFWQSDRRSLGNGFGALPEERGVRRRQLHGFYTRAIAHDKAEVRGTYHMPKEHRRGLRFFAENPGHVRASVQEHADVEDYVRVVGKEFDGLRLAVFGDTETLLAEIADQAFLVVAHGEVDGDQVYLALEVTSIGAFILRTLVWRAFVLSAFVLRESRWGAT